MYKLRWISRRKRLLANVYVNATKSHRSELNLSKIKVTLSFAHTNARELGVDDQLEFGFDSWVVGGRNGPVLPCTYGDLWSDNSRDCIIVGTRGSYMSTQRAIRGFWKNCYVERRGSRGS